MLRKLTFLTGFALGYILGARAGRGRYEQIKAMLRTMSEESAVQEAAAGVRHASEAAQDAALGKARDASEALADSVHRLASKVRHDKAAEEIRAEAAPYTPTE